MADFIIKDIKIPDTRTIELMRAELACISRDECNRCCENCDLVQDVDELIVAFREVISLLEAIAGTIQLPEGHGRGIDADAVIATYTPDSYELNKMHMTQESYDKLPTVAAIKRAISNALTLIPAEGGGEDGI